MGFKKFSLLIVFRTVLVMLNLILLAYFISASGFHAAIIVLILLLLTQLSETMNFIMKTNTELVRFFDAARYADFSQKFNFKELGAGFGELGKAFEDILQNLHAARAKQEKELKHIKAVIEQVPVPLISIHHTNKITLWNNAARRLFGSNHVTKTTDLAQFSTDFPVQIKQLMAGSNILTDIIIDGMEHKLSITASQIIINQQPEMLISMQDIQNELDLAQLHAWQDLVRVLTHEIMNSITPVASLAKTAADLIDDVQTQTMLDKKLHEDIDDIADAIKTVARRSDGLMNFVSGYRRLTRLPTPTKKVILVQDLLTQVASIATQNWPQKNITLTREISPNSLDISIDVNMIEQVLINLLQNAEHTLSGVSRDISTDINNDVSSDATSNKDKAEVSISASLNKRGRVVITISDNGCGISKAILEKIFVPFFTTKRNGSGVGLALSRQIMLAHGGSINAKNNETQGTTFTLIF
ncbi:MAG: ATP-binding protein [Colwellia sp.]